MLDVVVRDPRDMEYVRSNYRTLEDACIAADRDITLTQSEIDSGRRPRASYHMPDGTPYVPADYFELETDRERFVKRLQQAHSSSHPPLSDEAIQEEWEGLLSGVYSVCLHHPTPENIARKNILMGTIDALIAEPRSGDERWAASLQAAVDELDRLERPFSPVLDRERFGKPPSRDTYIVAVRERFLRVPDTI